ncbi:MULTISPECIES: hypothetical protein [Enterococcus]|nr:MULTISPECIES: hypothetical protein [Enterococcus]
MGLVLLLVDRWLDD